MNIICDRCKKVVENVCNEVYNIEGKDVIVTGGYYNFEDGWSEYRRGNEKKICDECMFSDPKYIAVYGKT